jgi:dTDP-4-dehydrorhamnose reductase
MKIAILGGTGMLGSMLVDYLSNHFEVVASYRNVALIKDTPNVEWKYLDTNDAWHDIKVLEPFFKCGWVINAIGVIKQKLTDDKAAEMANTIFPFQLATMAYMRDTRVIQIATDCVFSGRYGGNYTETSIHDPQDVYGKTKSNGEVNKPHVCQLRCSIVGTEPNGQASLLGWFLSQPQGATLNGYTNHIWNGITTLAFSKICRGIIVSNGRMPSMQHLVPADIVSKADLLGYFAEYFDRQDIQINYVEAHPPVDRSLATEHANVNRHLWFMAGYKQIPTIEEMIAELALYKRGGR